MVFAGKGHTYFVSNVFSEIQNLVFFVHMRNPGRARGEHGTVENVPGVSSGVVADHGWSTYPPTLNKAGC